MVWNLKTEHKVALGFGVALATILAIALSFYFSNRELIYSNQHVAQTSQILLRVSNILAAITEAETSQRGFVLTADEDFLTPYYTAVTMLDEELTLLRQLMTGKPQQRETVDHLEQVIQQRLRRIETVIELRRREGFNAALDLINTKKGSELMQEIRSIAAAIGKEEQEILDRRHQHFRTSSRHTFLAFSSLICANYLLLTLVYVMVKKDLRRRREAQDRQKQLLDELAAANKELNDFAYVVSHDLKAPLRGISSLAGFLMTDQKQRLDPEGREQLELLSNRVQRMHNLIEGILQYSRMARHQEEKTLVNLNQLVREIIELLMPPANIQIQIVRPLPVLFCEKTPLQQVFQNLLSNAIKFMDKPQGLIKIDFQEHGLFWKFSISDNGPGIEEQYHAKIFQLFQTLQARDEFENTGIGLAVVKKAVEKLGGEVWVESQPGAGSTFIVLLPRKTPQ